MAKKKEPAKKKVTIEDQLRFDLFNSKIDKFELEIATLKQQTDMFRNNQILLGLKCELNQYKIRDAGEALARVKLGKSKLEERLIKELDVKSGKIAYDEEGNVV